LWNRVAQKIAILYNDLPHLSLRSGLFVALIGMIAAMIISIWLGSSGQQQITIKAPPPDVTAVMQHFAYSEELSYATLSVQGRRGVQRGKRMLGLRLTAAQTTNLEQIAGTLTNQAGEVLQFSAASATWDIQRNAPLELQRQVVLILRGSRLGNVQRALLYLREGQLVVYADQRRVYQLH